MLSACINNTRCIAPEFVHNHPADLSLKDVWVLPTNIHSIHPFSTSLEMTQTYVRCVERFHLGSNSELDECQQKGNSSWIIRYKQFWEQELTVSAGINSLDSLQTASEPASLLNPAASAAPSTTDIVGNRSFLAQRRQQLNKQHDNLFPEITNRRDKFLCCKLFKHSDNGFWM